MEHVREAVDRRCADLRGFHALSAARLGVGTGNYEVLFDRNVRGCAYVATIGLIGTGVVSEPPAGEISVASRDTNANGVLIETNNSAGSSTDLPFHLVVHC